MSAVNTWEQAACDFYRNSVAENYNKFAEATHYIVSSRNMCCTSTWQVQ